MANEPDEQLPPPNETHGSPGMSRCAQNGPSGPYVDPTNCRLLIYSKNPSTDRFEAMHGSPEAAIPRFPGRIRYANVCKGVRTHRDRQCYRFLCDRLPEPSETQQYERRQV